MYLQLAERDRPSELPNRYVLAVAGLFIAAMAFDGFTSYAGLRGTTNDLRLATGLMAGSALAVLAVPVFNHQSWRRSADRRVLSGPWSVGGWLVIIATLFLVVRTGSTWLIGLGSIVGFSILFTFAVVNMAILSLLPWFERKADRALDLWPQALIALMVVALELGWATLAHRSLLLTSQRL